MPPLRPSPQAGHQRVRSRRRPRRLPARSSPESHRAVAGRQGPRFRSGPFAIDATRIAGEDSPCCLRGCRRARGHRRRLASGSPISLTSWSSGCALRIRHPAFDRTSAPTRSVLRLSGASDNPLDVALHGVFKLVQAPQSRRLEGADGQHRRQRVSQEAGAPSPVFQFAATSLISEPIEGTRWLATAEIPQKMQPSRLIGRLTAAMFMPARLIRGQYVPASAARPVCARHSTRSARGRACTQ